jgi:branched-chain amino acid transport system ATP-binding protein
MGVPLIVIDQDVAFLSALIDRLYLFDHGRIARILERADIPDHDSLMSMLFGAALA